MKYYPRAITSIFHSCLQQFPSVLLTGPRQSGKSTFLQQQAIGQYVTFDDPLQRDFALNDPNSFLEQAEEKPLILDEIQYVPEILQYIKIQIDLNRNLGKWIMTGSQQFHLMTNITETLAGRIALLDLYPFAVKELGDLNKTLEDILWEGMYPEPACEPQKQEIWLRSYLQTYLERDIRQMEALRNFRAFEMFIQLCAARHAQEFHAAFLARECGVSQPTIQAWSKLLESSFLAIFLPPFFKNYGKRIIKTPKFYFVDPSIVAYLTRQPAKGSLLTGNMGGALFEGLIISEIWKTFANCGKRPTAYFWRSQSGLEVDVLIQAKGKLWPVEIKLTATPSMAHLRPIQQFLALAEDEGGNHGILVCRVEKITKLPGNHIAIPWFAFSEWLETIIDNK
ncbi:MAG: ATP-binding protein [SAR324 cluster bacterium]|nr:ATP-binding protein [SAR324 cluster bacterium]